MNNCPKCGGGRRQCVMGIAEGECGSSWGVPLGRGDTWLINQSDRCRIRELENELGRTRQLLLDSERNLRWARERITEACKLEDALKQLLRPHPGQSLADAVTERVEDAFREGKSGRPFRTDDEDLAWIHSDARRSFNPPPKVELRAPALGDVDGQFGG